MIHNDFIDEMKKILPTDEIPAFLDACDRPLKKSISVCKGKIDPDAFEVITRPWGRHLTPSPFHLEKGSYYIDRDDTSVALGKTFLYQGGFFYIQELAASLPASQISCMPGSFILDMAAAPGGKTTQLAHHLIAQSTTLGGTPGLVIANDIAPSRIKTMAHNLNLMGAYNTALTRWNGAMFGSHLPEFFDHVLLDAPCSGEGTRFKSDSALTYRRKEEINKITGTQLQLLISAIKTVKPGGTVIYSTCTLNPYENEEILARALDFFQGSICIEPVNFADTSPGVTLPTHQRPFDEQAVARCWPHRQGTGGFFVAKMKKLHSTQKSKSTKDSKLLPKNHFSLDTSKKLQKKIGSRLSDTYGIQLDCTKHHLIASKEIIYLTSPALLDMLPVLHLEKAGIPILKVDRELYRPTHHLGNLLGSHATKNFITLSDEQIQAYSEGQPVEESTFPPPKKLTLPYQIVKRREYGMSVVKILPDMIKNKWGG